MGAYNGSNTWVENIYQFETTDQVMGGPEGIDNLPLKQLADRTKYLYERAGWIGRYASVLELTNNTTLDASALGKLIIGIKNAAVLTITLPAISPAVLGMVVPVMAQEIGGVINVVPAAGNTLQFGADAPTVMHVHNRERLCFVAVGTKWVVCDYVGNFNNVGEEVKGRAVTGNVLALDGSVISRDTKPRLWKFANTLGAGIVSESTWQSGIRYNGFFSTGNNTSTFRLPDERGMFERMLDQGRGIDVERMDNAAGGFEDELIKNHWHNQDWIIENPLVSVKPEKFKALQVIELNENDGPGGQNHIRMQGTEPIIQGLGQGSETRPKNIGKLNFIKY